MMLMMEAGRPDFQQESESDGGHDYIKAVYASVLGWYESAERKAQLILTLDGVFLSIVAASALSDPTDLESVVERFGVETWILLGSTGVALIASVLAALLCVWSRMYSTRELRREFERAGVDKNRADTYPPSVLWFFQMLAALPAEEVKNRLMQADQCFEARALAEQIVRLAPRVWSKHRFANAGFGLLVLTLMCLLATAMSYVIRVA